MTSVEISLNANIFAATGKNGSVQLWNLNTGQKDKNLRHPSDSPALSVDFVPGGKYIVTGCKDGFAYLWDINSGEIIQKFQTEKGPVYDVKATGNGRFIVTTDQKGNVCLWDIKKIRNCRKTKRV